MNSQDYRNLQEAYLDVYDSDLREEQEFESWIAGLLDEGYDLSDYNWDEMYEIYNEARDPGVKPYPGGARYSLRTQVRQSNEVKPAGEKPPGETGGYGSKVPPVSKDERNFANVLAPKPKEFPRIFGKLDPANTRTREITRQMGKPKPEAPRRGVIKASYEPDIYDVILEYLINEGYADTYEAAESIMVNMSEEWRDDILNEGIGSAIRGLFGKKKEPEAPKPLSRGAELRRRYNTGPDKSETSAKRRILDKTRARAERDEKEYGDSTYSKSVAADSAAAHEKYLRAGYNKYGADRPDSGGMGGSGGSGRGNKARKRAAALATSNINASYEPDLFDYMMEYLMIEGYADTNENALVIMANMSEEWRDSIVEEKKPLPIGKMKKKEMELMGKADKALGPALRTPINSPERNAALRTSERGSNISDVRRSVSTRGGKMKFPMPEVGRYKPKDED